MRLVRPSVPAPVLAALAVLAAGCTPSEPECVADLQVYADVDGDGYGDPGADLGKVCELAAGQSESPLDCDDADEQTFPGARERCDGADNDCDGTRDEDFELKQYYRDRDKDGYGEEFESVLSCEAEPPEGFVGNKKDCDDKHAKANPEAREVCGGGDEDCDGLPDDADDSVDPTTFDAFFRDADADGLGGRTIAAEGCALPPGMARNNKDCDDTDNLVGRRYWYADTDGDLFGDARSEAEACAAPPGFVADNTDCDDTDARWNVDRQWFHDTDGDGFGGGTVVSIQCTPPNENVVEGATDCDDLDDQIHPGAPDICLDGIDTNCNGTDRCQTCKGFLDTDPTSASGAYTLDLDEGAVDVWCDMTTDGGGWTLVANTMWSPPDDRAVDWSDALEDLDPGYYYDYFSRGIWRGLKDVVGPNTDIRFTCSNDWDDEFEVDLSFYQIHWYQELTAGTDADSCFNEPGGYDQPAPARRNNLDGDSRDAGDDWDSGVLRGEDFCWDMGDFAVDFDNNGKYPASYYGFGWPGDDTDWGEADWSSRCGSSGYYGQNTWQVWVRE